MKMSSFMSRFGLNKKTSESPAAAKQHPQPNAASNALSRNYGGSVGPIKANNNIGSAAYSSVGGPGQPQQRNPSSVNTHHLLTISNMGGGSGIDTSQVGTGMYAIQTEIDAPSRIKQQSLGGSMTGSALQSQLTYQKQQIDQLEEQVKDLETNLQINKEIIKNLLESNSTVTSTNGGQLVTLQHVLKSIQGENANLQQQVQKLTQQRNEAQQKLHHGTVSSSTSHHQQQQQQPQRDSSVGGGQQNVLLREKMQLYEKQLAEVRANMLQKDQLSQQREQAYNELLQLVAGHSSTKNDKLLIQKLRELKSKHESIISGLGGNMNGEKYHNFPEEEATLVQENKQLKRDLEFSISEIERLRAKLVVDDDAVYPALQDELQNNSRKLSIGGGQRDLSADYIAENRMTNPEIGVNIQPSRNASVNLGRSNTAGAGIKPVPKLDFKRLKKVQEFKDWYTYACKLEDSVKFLRDRMRSLETDHDTLNEKYRKEVASREQLFQANDQLNKALRRANIKIAEIKEKYRQNIAKKCYYCKNEFEMTTQTMKFNSTLEDITSEIGKSFLSKLPANNGGFTMEQSNMVADDSFGEKLAQEDDIAMVMSGGRNQDNFLIDETAAQTESDKRLQTEPKKKPATQARQGGSGASVSVLKISQINREGPNGGANNQGSRNVVSSLQQHVTGGSYQRQQALKPNRQQTIQQQQHVQGAGSPPPQRFQVE